MRSLSAPELLEVWERGERLHPVDKALMLLAAACPECKIEELAGICIGQRDALLFAMRELSFGPEMHAFCVCPLCDAPLEWSMRVADLLKNARGCPNSELRFTAEGYDIHFRFLNSMDLSEAISLGAEKGPQLLLARSIVRAVKGHKEIAPDTLPDAVKSVLESRLLECDPLCEIELDMECPACGNRWPVLLDILSFFWAELDAQARSLLHQIDVLARYYGWSESEILSMSRQRRQHYIDMVTL
jgi:hypothetical protein